MNEQEIMTTDLTVAASSHNVCLYVLRVCVLKCQYNIGDSVCISFLHRAT